MQKDWIPQEMPRVVALAPGGGGAARWEPAPVRSAGSGCGSGVWEPDSGSFGSFRSWFPRPPQLSVGTSELGRGLKPPIKTAPAGLTESGHSTGCVIASQGRATARGIACGYPVLLHHPDPGRP